MFCIDKLYDKLRLLEDKWMLKAVIRKIENRKIELAHLFFNQNWWQSWDYDYFIAQDKELHTLYNRVDTLIKRIYEGGDY